MTHKKRGSAAAAARFALLLAIALPVASAQAQGHADRNEPAYLRPGVSVTSNGVPVQIQTPSAAGVSRNVYRQFDVAGRGVVLNNSTTGSGSALVGQVGGNRALSRGPARIILNAVNSPAPSTLLGPVEVAESRAEFILANPSGITCDGCGFINVSRVTLATTQAVTGSDGTPAGLEVGNGTVRIGPGGMNALTADYTDIISRAVEINRQLAARELTVVGVLRPAGLPHPRVRTGAVISSGGISLGGATTIAADGTEWFSAGQVVHAS